MSAVDYLDGLGDLPNLPVWNDELYLEFHRGCYTTHADQKRWNRLCEGLLYRAELWSAVASIVTGFEVPQATLEEAWKGVLFNQFHDILQGPLLLRSMRMLTGVGRQPRQPLEMLKIEH
ncbi:hypothetical protein [Limnospira platensis]|uniref:hypothetical protein n=1 Tax=Limnospira platensis TaxID=118562 RepID=UPI002889DFC1